MNFTKSHIKKITFIFFLASFLITGCVKESSDDVEVVKLPIDQRISILLKALHIAKGNNYANTCQQIIDYGEAGIPYIAEGLKEPYPLIRTGAIYCMSRVYSETQSSTALDYKEDIAKLLNDPVRRVRLEAASALCDMKDYRGTHLLIAGLKNRSPYVRMVSHYVLEQTFKMPFGYDHLAPQDERDKSAGKWEQWWVENKDKYLKS